MAKDYYINVRLDEKTYRQLGEYAKGFEEQISPAVRDIFRKFFASIRKEKPDARRTL